MADLKRTMIDYLAELGLVYFDPAAEHKVVIPEPKDYWIPNHPVIDNHVAVLYITSDPPSKIQWPDDMLN